MINERDETKPMKRIVRTKWVWKMGLYRASCAVDGCIIPSLQLDMMFMKRYIPVPKCLNLCHSNNYQWSCLVWHAKSFL